MNTQKPVSGGHSLTETKWIEERENEIAMIITCCEDVRRWDTLVAVLLREGYINEEYGAEMTKSINRVHAGLVIGKHNTASLRTRKA